MKKILIVSGSLPPISCGVGYYTARLSRELAAEGVVFELLSTQGVHTDTPVPLLSVPNWKIRSLSKILSDINKSRAEIIHIQYPAVGYRRQLGINLLPYVLRLTKPHLKILVTLHEYNQSRWIGRIRNRITILPAHKVIVSNQPDLKALKRLGRKILVIPIGANFEKVPRRPKLFRKIMRSQKLNPDGKTIVFFGYAFPSKRLELVLDSLTEPALQDYQLLIFPELNDKSAYHRMLKRKIAKLNLKYTRVGVNRFLNGDDASAVLQECKYFILPSSQPLSAKSGTAIAAVQNGLVLISTGASNSQSSLPFKHLENCYLLDPVNHRTIAESVAELDSSTDKIMSIRRGARELKDYFSWDNIVKEHLKTYAEL